MAVVASDNVGFNKIMESPKMTMYIETASPVPFGAVFSLNVVNFVDTTIANFAEWNAARKTANALSALSASQLDDIGILPGDVRLYR